jgi:hypothetical protein
MTASPPRASMASTSACLSYPLSAITTAGRVPASRASAWVMSGP